MSFQQHRVRISWDEGVKCLRDFLISATTDIGNQRLLLAVSGGVDSMCMLALVAATGFRAGVAHVNYKLRGQEADQDAQLVHDVCLQYGLPFYLKEVNLREDYPGNIQQEARQIRYRWFAEVCLEHDYHYICTAHQQDDATESFFINVIRGTGLKGLIGIPPARENILRPMLCFRRDEITEMVRLKGIPYRDDASNFTHDYLRNRIRHNIIPLFEAEQGKFIRRMQSTQDRLAGEYRLLERYLNALKDVICRVHQDILYVDTDQVRNTVAPSIVLLYVLGEFGFNLHQCRSMILRYHQPGVVYYSSTHQVTVDRTAILVTALDMPRKQSDYLLPGMGVFSLPEGCLRLELAPALAYDADRRIELVDGAKLQGRLVLRRWRHGDTFVPLGGPGTQKLQDYFTNEKLSIPDKERIWLLTCDDTIVWICGMRLDDRFKVTPETTLLYRLTWQPVDS